MNAYSNVIINLTCGYNKELVHYSVQLGKLYKLCSNAEMKLFKSLGGNVT